MEMPTGQNTSEKYPAGWGEESNWVGRGEDIRGERLSALTGDGVE